jgi:hypothetical protein
MSNEITTVQQSDIDKLIEISRNNAISTGALIETTNMNTRAIEEQGQAIADLTDRMNLREQNEMLSPSQKKALKRDVGATVYGTLGLKKSKGKLTSDSKRKRNVYGTLFFARLYSELNNRFDVSHYEEIRAIDYNDAKDFVRTWVPMGGVDALKREAEENWGVNHPDISLEQYLQVLFVADA